MQKKLTITVDEEIYEGLYKTVGPRKISKFVQELVRPACRAPQSRIRIRRNGQGQEEGEGSH